MAGRRRNSMLALYCTGRNRLHARENRWTLVTLPHDSKTKKPPAQSNQCVAHPILPTAITNPTMPAINSHGLPLTARRIPVPRTVPIPIQTRKAQSNFMEAMLPGFLSVSRRPFRVESPGLLNLSPTFVAPATGARTALSARNASHARNARTWLSVGV